MIQVEGLTKRYGSVTAVDNVEFRVHPGAVTGFLGPNGAGKTTTMRMIVGLERPTEGRALVDGVPYRDLDRPMAHVGALLDAGGVHPRRSARNHLLAVADATGATGARVDEVLRLVGLADVAGRAAGGFSLGMSQRLGLAQALLGDPEHLILDEPINGLDPEGIRWVRHLLRGLAAEGRTVLVSSHLLAEMAQTADRLLIIGRGRLVADTTVDDFTASVEPAAVIVRCAHLHVLEPALDAAGLGAAHGVTRRRARDDRGREVLELTGTTTDEVGAVAYDHGVPLAELTERRGSLEDAFVAMTGGDVEYQAGGAPAEGMPR